jgi:lipopolysaccharide export system protein LptA
MMKPIKRLRLTLIAFISFSLLSTAVAAAHAQSSDASKLILQADVQEANPEADVINLRGNVLFQYPRHQLEGTAAAGQYFTVEQKLILVGNAQVTQQGEVLRNNQIVCLLVTGQCTPAVE